MKGDNLPVRVQLSRKKGRMPPNTVKVSRPGKFGNPFCVGHIPGFCSPSEHYRASDQADAVRLFEEWISYSADGAALAKQAMELAGKNLACWCALGTPCHADVLLRLANMNPDGSNSA